MWRGSTRRPLTSLWTFFWHKIRKLRLCVPDVNTAVTSSGGLGERLRRRTLFCLGRPWLCCGCCLLPAPAAPTTQHVGRCSRPPLRRAWSQRLYLRRPPAHPLSLLCLLAALGAGLSHSSARTGRAVGSLGWEVSSGCETPRGLQGTRALSSAGREGVSVPLRVGLGVEQDRGTACPLRGRSSGRLAPSLLIPRRGDAGSSRSVCAGGVALTSVALPLCGAEVLHPVFIIYLSSFLWHQRLSPEMNELAYGSDPSCSQRGPSTYSPCLSLSSGSRSSEHPRLPLQHLLPGCDQRALLSSAEVPTSGCFPADTGRRPRVHSGQCPCPGSAGPAHRNHRHVHIVLVVARYLEYHR